ncbi:MAG: TMEM165/GDT1 family protein [Clostridia bacterium]|nr:TMEM165/GDT1 family protein [Clostridia bacterium]
MSFLYPILVAFLLVFISELGDKTQLLVLSFSSKLKASTILIGVALGSFFSHGIAILFGSSIGLLNNSFIHDLLEIITFLSFIVFGIFSFLPQKEEKENSKKDNFIMKLSKLGIGYILIIAFSIAVGELGDKTFLASIGLGISYPNQKLFLIIGAILGMVISDLLAIIFGKLLTKKIPEALMQKLSGLLFIFFGVIGFIKFIIY